MEHAVFTIEPRHIKEAENTGSAYDDQEFTFQTSSLAADRSSRQVAFAEGTSTGDDADLTSYVEQATPKASQPSRSSSRGKERSRSPQQLHLCAWQAQAPQQKTNFLSSSSKSRSRSSSPNRGLSPGSRSGSPSRELSAQQLAANISSSDARDSSGRSVAQANYSSAPETAPSTISSRRLAAPLIPLGRPTDADDSYAASKLRSSREAVQPHSRCGVYVAAAAAASRSTAAVNVDGTNTSWGHSSLTSGSSRKMKQVQAQGIQPQADPYSSRRRSSSSPTDLTRSSRQARSPSPTRTLHPQLGEGHCVAIVSSSGSGSKPGRSRSCGRARGAAGVLPGIQEVPVDVAHYNWLKIQLAKTSITADAAASRAHSLQQQRDELQQQTQVLQQQMEELQRDKGQLQDRVRDLEGQLKQLQETDRTADVWEAGVERLLVRLQQQQHQQQQQQQEVQECSLHREELQIARECIEHQGRLLKEARAGAKEQRIELDASAAAARVAWEMYENLIQQLVPLLAKAAGAVDLLNRSDINWLDGTGSSKPYKAGVLQGAKVLAALAQLPHVIKQQLERRAHKAANTAIPHAVAGAYAAAEAAASAAAGMIAIESMRAATAAARRGASPSRQRQQQQQQQAQLQQLHKQHKQASSHFSVPLGLALSGSYGNESPLSRLRSPRVQPDKLRTQ